MYISHWFDKNTVWPNNKYLLEPCELLQEPRCIQLLKKPVVTRLQWRKYTVLGEQHPADMTGQTARGPLCLVWLQCHPPRMALANQRLSKEQCQDSIPHEHRPREPGMFSMKKRIRGVWWLKYPTPAFAHHTVQYYVWVPIYQTWLQTLPPRRSQAPLGCSPTSVTWTAAPASRGCRRESQMIHAEYLVPTCLHNAQSELLL